MNNYQRTRSAFDSFDNLVHYTVTRPRLWLMVAALLVSFLSYVKPAKPQGSLPTDAYCAVAKENVCVLYYSPSTGLFYNPDGTTAKAPWQ